MRIKRGLASHSEGKVNMSAYQRGLASHSEEKPKLSAHRNPIKHIF
ncbi:MULTISPECIES: hypothetical protein [Cytobacillus]|nr:hypothetical protein [Cytobacillus kochii]MCM3324432.1 hypothetical protein [Cytobacillus kochii]MCM3346825.1 hypothetical protein [Cytobacillus kochii]